MHKQTAWDAFLQALGLFIASIYIGVSLNSGMNAP
jgi:hypothetical protein